MVKSLTRQRVEEKFGHISDWNVSQVTYMEYPFYNATTFNVDIGKWNVRNVKNMCSMFRNAFSFN